MIDEIRVSTKDGRDVFVGSLDLETGKVEVVFRDSNLLFAGFISAILTVSEEVNRAELTSIGYRGTKIVFEVTNELIFMVLANVKVPDHELVQFLRNLRKAWLKQFKDNDYIAIFEKDKIIMKTIIEKSLLKSYWWILPKYNIKNNYKLIKSIISSPGSSYYVPYISDLFIITNLLFVCLTLYLSFFLGSVFVGFGAEIALTTPMDLSDFFVSGISILFFWLVPPLLIKLLDRINFEITDYLKISGILLSLLSILFLASGRLYFIEIYAPIISRIQSEELKLVVIFLMTKIPVNFGFFSFLILNGYTTAFANRISLNKYFIYYLSAYIIALSLLETFLPYVAQLV